MLKTQKSIIFFVTLFLSIASSSFGAELSLNHAIAKDGKTIEIPFIIDQAVNIAGIKIALNYDRKIIKYLKITKSKASSPLMHIVNSKNPGRLIVVMAGARGIKGKQLTLFSLSFEILQNEKNPFDIEITKVELISDDLKPVKCSFKKKNVIKEQTESVLPVKKKTGQK